MWLGLACMGWVSLFVPSRLREGSEYLLGNNAIYQEILNLFFLQLWSLPFFFFLLSVDLVVLQFILCEVPGISDCWD